MNFITDNTPFIVIGCYKIKYTFVSKHKDDFFIRTKVNYNNHLPFDIEQFFLQDKSAEKEYKEINEEEFKKQKEKVLNKIQIYDI